MSATTQEPANVVSSVPAGSSALGSQVAAGQTGQGDTLAAPIDASTPAVGGERGLSALAASFQPAATNGPVGPAPPNPTKPDLKTVAQQATDRVTATANARAFARRLANPNNPGAVTDDEINRTIQKFGLRTGFGGSDDELSWIETNNLTITYPQKIYVYSVVMVRDYDADGKEIVVKKQADRLLALTEIVGTGPYPVMRARQAKWVSDGDLIWSTAPLFHNDDPSVQPQVYRSTPTAAITYSNEMDQVLRLDNVTFSYKLTLDLNQDIGALFCNSTTSHSGGLSGLLTRGLNAFLTSHVHRNAPATFTTIGANTSFRNGDGNPLDDPNGQPARTRRSETLRALSGFFLSARPGIESILININVATSPFFENLTVHDLITHFQAPHHQRGHARDLGEIRKILKGAKVQIIYNTNGGQQTFTTRASRIRFIEGTFRRCNDQGLLAHPYQPHHTLATFYNRQGPYKDVAEFPRPAINITGNDFAINVGKDPSRFQQGQEYYPASALRVVEWQPFRGRLTGLQTSKMVRCALLDPADHKTRLIGSTSTEGLGHFGFAGQDAGADQAGLHAANIRAGTQLVQVPGRFLTAPNIAYAAGGRKTANLACWDLRNVRFAQASAIQELPVLNLGDYPITNDHEKHIKNALVKHGLAADRDAVTTVGSLTANLQICSLTRGFESAIQGLMNSVPNNHDNPILVVLPAHNYDLYATIKRVADLSLGVKTICVTWGALNRRGPGQGNTNLDDQTASNIALKFNIRSGGTNHTLSSPDMDRCLSDSAQRCDTIVIGADVAHPNRTAHDHTPSIASVVGSTDAAFQHYPGSMRLQRSKREDITALWDMVKERLLDWHQKHQRFPSKMLFYRDGVSESQYDILRRRELPQLQIAINEAYRSLHPTHALPTHGTSPPATPAPVAGQTREDAQRASEQQWADQVESDPHNIPLDVTFVVVGKRHNTRFYPTTNSQTTRVGGGRQANGNVKPGLAVDQVITHPVNMDFYLQSHKAIKGMGRAAHYYVLRNNMDLSIDELQSITHTLCYSYAKATRGVSYCAPAYYADRLCDRGRAYLRHWLVHAPGYGQISRRQRSGPAGPRETLQQYRDFVADEISQDATYWAFNGHRPQYGGQRKNPWHPDLDNTMFYL